MLFIIILVCLKGLKLSFKLSNALLERASHGLLFFQVPTQRAHLSHVLRIFYLLERMAVSSQAKA